jgi:Ca2+:H+ antiporter
MARWIYLLLLAVPATFLVEGLHAPPLAVFICAALGLIPLAGLIGQATEVLAERLGHGIGGLLNATFGNAAEIIIGLAALSAGLPEVVRASLAGSIIGNVLLVLGCSMLFGGWRHRQQAFAPSLAGQYAVMLILSVIGMAIPSLLATVGEGARPGSTVVRGSELHQLSLAVAVILLLCYFAYIIYSVFGVHAASGHAEALRASSHEEEGGERSKAMREKVESLRARRGLPALLSAFIDRWQTTYWLPILVLAATTVVVAIVSEVLVGTIEPLTRQIGLNEFFVGLILLPIVGNAAEHFSAITAAMRNRMEVSMAITAGSSIQIALLAAPILVLAGPLVGVPLDLNFSLLEVATFGLAALLYALISLDGQSTWLEGLLLVAFYVILGISIFFIPA